MTDHTIAATAREAGRNIVHTVTLDGRVVGTRRSAHRYHYAIAYWTRTPSGRTIIVARWSRKPTASGSSFAIPIVDA
jgi:hypothetical protein